MGRIVRWLTAATLMLGASGCVERRFLVESNPPGAAVLVNGEYKGTTPVSVPFTYYGKYDITLARDGYETVTYPAMLRRPWFEYFPADFFAENLYPLHLQDNKLLRYDLQPLQQTRTEDVLNQAGTLRQRGQAIRE
jgi:hypothetical protein